MTRPIDIALWVVVPYVCLAVFVVGHVWRYRYDKFGWTTRSSQLYERHLLRWGSPLFHFGILFVFLGHVMGLGIPKPWTQAVGISDEALAELRQTDAALSELRRNQTLARTIGATGTPTFVVGDRVIQGAVGYDALKAAIAEARQR